MPSLPERLLLHDVRAGTIVPRYLGARDAAWIGTLIVLASRHAGLPHRDLVLRARSELAAAAGSDALDVALHALDEASAAPPGPPVRPALARRIAFAERTASRGSREDVLRAAARRLGCTPDALERALFADAPLERRAGPPPPDLDAGELARRANLRVAQGIVARAARLELEVEGHARRVVQHATWQGLICTAEPDGPERRSCRIQVSGPLAILRATRLYGRALASLVPILPWCGRFRLRADVRLGGRDLAFGLDEAAPIARGTEPRRHDSGIEAAFEAEVRRLMPSWDVVREPRALPVAGSFVFPDFAIGPRSEPGGRVLVEIVGWWTRDYLEAKLARLRAAGCGRLITCIEERAGRHAGDPAGLDVIPFRRRVDAGAVIARASEMLGLAPPLASARVVGAGRRIREKRKALHPREPGEEGPDPRGGVPAGRAGAAGSAAGREVAHPAAGAQNL